MTPVTDPSLLAQLDESPAAQLMKAGQSRLRPVTDQAVLAELEPDITADVAKSGATGIAKGVIQTGGLIGDIRDLARSGAEYVTTKIHERPVSDQARLEYSHAGGSDPVKAGRAARTGGLLSAAPTSQQLQSGVERLTGEFYKPKTAYGEFAQTAGEFLPAAVTGPGGLARRVAVQALAPAVASETAGQLAAGTRAEPYARVAAALVAPAAVGGVGKAARAVRNVDTAPSITQLRGQADELYKTADNAGVIVSKGSLKNAVGDIRTAVTEAGIDATLHPKALAAFRRLEQGAAENQSLKGMDILRRVASGAAQSVDRDEARIARIIRDKLDDYLEGLTTKDVLAGDAKKATEATTQARELWARMRKGEQIERLIERAGNRAQQFSGSGYENALRTEFRNLAQNEKRMARFSRQEQTAIRNVARGGVVSNAFRALGRFAPRGVVSAALSGGIGYGLGGEQGGLAMLGAGELGRQVATVMTRNRARLASELARRGGPAPRRGAADQNRIARLLALETAAQQGLEPRN